MPKGIVLVENDRLDTQIASVVARSVGFESVHTFDTVTAARTFLEDALQGDGALPDAIVVDLDMGPESGFEMLRLWRSTSLRRIPLVVWSGLPGDHYQEMCAVFKVNRFVGKWDGTDALKACLTDCLEPADPAESDSVGTS